MPGCGAGASAGCIEVRTAMKRERVGEGRVSIQSEKIKRCPGEVNRGLRFQKQKKRSDILL